MKPSLKFLLKVALSLGLLVFVFLNTGIEKTLERLSSANLWYIPLGVAVYLLSQCISSLRWKFLAEALGFQHSLREYYDYYLMGMYFSLFLPSSIGGDAGRMYYLAKSAGRKKREALLTLVAERGMGLVALLFLTSLAMLCPLTDPIPATVRYTIVASFLAVILGFFVVRTIQLEPLAARFPKLSLLVDAQVYWKNWPLLAKTFGASLITHGCMLVIHLMIAQAMGVTIELVYLVAVYGVVSLASLLPSLNGIGVRENAYKLLLTAYGLSPETSLAFGLYWFLISTLTSLVGGIILVKGHYQTPPAQEPDVC